MSDRPPFGFGPGGSSGSGGSGSGGNPGGFGGFGGLGGPAGAPFFAELEKLLSWQGGPINWELARQLAYRVAADGDSSLTAAEKTAVADAVRLADLWLDPVTTLPSGVTATEAWTRTEWVEKTLSSWRLLCDPVASRVVGAMGEGLTGGLAQLADHPELASQLPPGFDLAQLTGGGAAPFMGMMNQVGGLLFGAQVGQGIGALASETVSSTDIGLPLGSAGTAALLPAAVTAFGEGLEVPADEVRLYLALREAAHHRLYGHVNWLRGHVLAAIEEYARGISVDAEAIGRTLQNIDPTKLDPEHLQESLGEGVFADPTTPEQRAALARLETLLALVEGWVDNVVDTAATAHLPAAAKLRETVRRRRASGGPAEQTFATLVGLELRPRRLREAAALWETVRSERGMEARDAIWEHPDLLPGSEDLDDPDGYLRRSDRAITGDSSLLGPDDPRGAADSGDAPEPGEPG